MVSFTRLSSAAPRASPAPSEPQPPPPGWLAAVAVAPAGLALPWHPAAASASASASASTVHAASSPSSERSRRDAGGGEAQSQGSELLLRTIICDLGPAVCEPSAMPSLRAALKDMGRPSEKAVARAVLAIAAPPSSGRISSPASAAGGVPPGGTVPNGSSSQGVASPTSGSDVPTVFSMFQMFTVSGRQESADGVGSNSQASQGHQPAVDPHDWNPATLVKVLEELATASGRPLDWPSVVRHFDVPELPAALSDHTFRFILHVYRLATGSPALPGASLVGSWAFPQAQLAILSAALTNPGSVDWETVKPAVDVPAEDVASPFRCVPLIEALVSLDARQLLTAAMGAKPDIVLLALSVSSPQAHTAIRQQLLVALIASRLGSFPSTGPVIKRIWMSSRPVLEVGIQAMWQADPSCLPRILDVVQYLGALTEFLTFSLGFPLDFTLDLAILAFRREHLNLDKWLTERLAEGGLPVLSSCVAYLCELVAQPGYLAAQSMSLEAAAIFFKCLFSAIPASSQALRPGVADTYLELRRVYDIFVSLNARLADLTTGWDGTNKDKTVGSVAAHPRSPTPAASNVTTVDPPGDGDDPIVWPSEVDAEAQANFKNLYQEQISVPQVIEILREKRASPNLHDQQVYSCMIHTLFDEYRFLDNYPQRELQIAGTLFGAMAEYGVLAGKDLGMLLNTVLQALTTIVPPVKAISRVGTFGLFALSMFKARLPEFPLFCRRLLQSFKTKESFPDLVTEVTGALERSAAPANADGASAVEVELGPDYLNSVLGNNAPVTSTASSSAAVGVGEVSSGDSKGEPIVSFPTDVENASTRPPSVPANSASSAPAVSEAAVQLSVSPTQSRATGISQRITASALRPSPSGDGTFQLATVNNETLLNAPQQSMDVPSADLQDKIHFVFNNLSLGNLDTKQEEFLGFFDVRFTDFLAHYIVVRRVTIEPNHHEMYHKFMTRLSSRLPDLYKKVLDQSFINVRILLDSGKIVSSSSERAVLKSLASWIGALTLGRNKALLRKDLDIKELILDAYSNGRLIAVVPFVSKLLVTAKGSFVFRPTNPWLRAILRLLKEIYLVPDLKLNVKFELPLLTKELGIDANAIEQSDLLSTRAAPVRDGNPDFTAIKKQAGIPSPVRSASPISSPTRQGREAYPSNGGINEANDVGSSGVPIFSLGGPPQAGPSSAANLGLMGTSLGDIPSVLTGPGTNVRASVPGSDTVADLATIMANASLASGGVLPSTMQGASLRQMPGTAGIPPTRGGPGAAAAAAQQAAAAAAAANEASLLQNLAQHVVVSSSLVLFQTNPHLKRYVPGAIDRAVRDIIAPVVERSCAIATITTRELALKDFAHEMDPAKMQKSAKQMVQQLAGSLALVTCKEPLRVSMSSQLRQPLSTATSVDANLLEHTVQVLCSTNLEVGCAIIEHAAAEKAARDIMNEVIAPVFNARRQNPQRHSMGLLGPSSAQDVLRVYDDFARLPRGATAATASASTVPVSVAPTGGYAYQQPVPVSSSTPMRSQPGEINPGLSQPSAAPPSRPHVPPQLQRAPPAVVRHAGYPALHGGSDPTPAAPHAAPPVRRGLEVAQAQPAASSALSTVSEMAAPAAMAEAMRIATAQAPPNLNPQVSASASSAPTPGDEKLSTQQVLERFNQVYPQLTAAIVRTVGVTSPSAESVTSVSGDVALADLPPEHEVQQYRLQIAHAVKRSLTADEASMAVAQKVFNRLYEGDSNLHREVHVALLESMRESSRRLSKELVSWLAYSEDAKKLNRECVIALLRPGNLLHITSYDELVAKTCENGRNIAALDFAAFLVKRAIIDEPLSTTRELYLTLDLLAKVGRSPNAPSLPSAAEGLIPLVEMCRTVVHRPAPSPSVSSGGSAGGGGPAYPDGHLGAAAKAAKLTVEAESLDPQGSRETVASVLTEWHKVLSMGTSSRGVPDSIISQFVTQARSTTLYNDESRDRFLRIGVDLVCSATRTALSTSSTGISSPIASVPYTPVEAMARLVAALCKTETSGESAAKGVSLLNAFFQALSRCIVRAGHGGDVRPHFRLFLGIIVELSVGVPPPDPAESTGTSPESDVVTANGALPSVSSDTAIWNSLDPALPGRSSDSLGSGGLGVSASGSEGTISTANFQVLSTIASALNSCNPHLAPSFAFAWLQILSNPDVMPRILAYRSGKGWQPFRQLLVSLLSFLAPYLSIVSTETELPGPIRTLYRGVLRVLLVLLHDFPEFLCDYHFTLCDNIPTACIQMRNLVLSAYPRSMRLPDPFMPDLKVDKLAEMSSEPRVLSNLTTFLVSAGVKVVVDKYLHDPASQPASSLGLSMKLLMRDPDSRRPHVYNVTVINALVLYLGQQAIARSPAGSQPIINGPSTELLQFLLSDLDAEGRYHLLNGITNQLRYPNNHTHYFSCALLFLFRDSSQDFIKEQITRVLVERLIANRPHPWGLLITFIELIKNPAYQFWNHGFVRSVPQIERLFENVVRFCSGNPEATSGAGTSPSASQQQSAMPLAT